MICLNWSTHLNMNKNDQLYMFFPKHISFYQRLHENAHLIVKAENLALAEIIFTQVTNESYLDFFIPCHVANYIDPFLRFVGNNSFNFRLKKPREQYLFNFRLLKDGRSILITSAYSLMASYKCLKELFEKQTKEGVHVTINHKYSTMVQLDFTGKDNQLELITSLSQPKAFLLNRQTLKKHESDK